MMKKSEHYPHSMGQNPLYNIPVPLHSFPVHLQRLKTHIIQTYDSHLLTVILKTPPQETQKPANIKGSGVLDVKWQTSPKKQPQRIE
jgi:hypothetical protein